jgi:hypothetical protein
MEATKTVIHVKKKHEQMKETDGNLERRQNNCDS